MLCLDGASTCGVRETERKETAITPLETSIRRR
jgi:hypothetical protein